MRSKIIYTLISLSFFCNTSLGQVVFHNVEEVWKYADVHNVTIRNSRYELDKGVDTRKQAYMAFLPQVSATSTFTDNLALQTTLIPVDALSGGSTGTGAVKAVQFGQKYIYSAGVSAQLDILNLQTWYNVRTSHSLEELNKATLANTRKSIYQQLATQYYSCMLMDVAAGLAEKSRQLSDSVYLSVLSKYQAGSVNESSVDLARINRDRAEQSLITAQYQSVTARNNIRNLLDMSLGDSLTVETELKENISVATSTGYAEDPAVDLARKQVEVNLSQCKAANRAFIPTLTLNYSNTTQQNNNKFEPLSGPAWYPAQYWSLKASWNIFSGGTRWLQTQKSKISWHQSVMQLESASKQAAITDENLKLSYRKATAILEKSEQIMQASLDNYTHVTYRYGEGLATLDERLTAYSDYITYQNQYLNNLADLLTQVSQVKIRQLSFQ